MLLEPQPGSPEASSVCEQIINLAVGEQDGEPNRTRFTLITKDSLAEIAKQNSISGKRALAQALVWQMERDRQEGLALKKDKAMQDNEKGIEIRGEYAENTITAGAQRLEALSGDGTDASDNKQGFEDEEQDLEAVARGHAERERAKLELRAARLLTQIDDDLGAPDRVYILKGFPTTETDAAQFLEENNAYFTAPTKKRKSAVNPPPLGKPDNRPAFLSSLDAVIQLTTREIVKPPDASSSANTCRADSRPGTASSRGSARSAQSARSARDEQLNSPTGRGRELDKIADNRKRESAWDRLRGAEAPNPFTQASGAAKTLAVAQTKGGTVWQDLSFSYINIVAPPDPNEEDTIGRPSSSERDGDKSSAKRAPKHIGEIKDILELATEFNAMVTQMAFEKFDFHQWFSTAEVVNIPRKDRGVDIARAIAEAQRAGIGPLGSSSGANGSPARVKGSLWGTDQGLLTYSDLMLAVPDELSSMATVLHCMIAAVAPLSDASLGVVSLEDHLGGRTSETQDGSRTEGIDVGALASTEGPMPRPLARNVTLEFGDAVGERATRAALNRAVAIGEGRIDPRAVVAVERAAMAKLQNPRVVGQGALPREPEKSEKDRGTEQCELLTFTDLGRKDVDRARQIWSLADLVNAHHPPPGQGEKWSFEDRRYWDVLPPHVVQQILRAENGTEPLCLRKYYRATDELLVALHHESPPGRTRICSWDPCTSGSIPFNFRPSFKDWARMVVAKDSSYTPRTLLALGALMDVSKADLDRAKTKSIKVFPADHSLVVLTGFVATLERWLSVFKDGHVMGLRLADTSENTSSGGGTSDSRGADTKGRTTRQPQFLTEMTMSFDDDSRIVVKEGQPPPPLPSSRPASSSKGEKRKSAPTHVDAAAPPALTGGGRKPDGYGTVTCVHTFPTGLVVSTGSDGAVAMKFVLDCKRSSSGKVLDGFVPEAAKDEFCRAVVGKGTVVRYMRDGSTQMLFVTGDVVTRNGDETILTDKSGRRFMKAKNSSSAAAAATHVATPASSAKAKAPSTTDEAVPAAGAPDAPGKEWIPIQSVASATTNKPGNKTIDGKGKHTRLPESSDEGEGAPIRDAESGALVWCSPSGNGSVVVLYEDGLTVTRHADGTVQRWRRGEGGGNSVDSGLVLVECPGFASIEVDVEIQEMCSKHAAGKPVTITRGGNRARLRAVMPNGGATLVTYDTRVTSRVCGRVIYVHSDNTEVIANDKGEVVVRPRGLWGGRPVHGVVAGPNSSMPPNCEQPDLLVGAYTFDCLKGVMESEDTDRNRFVLDVTKTAFLREGFSISRAGGSAADRCNSPAAHNERGEQSKKASSRPSSGKSEGVTIDLAGETIGVRSEALVNTPLEPRLFIYRRDGSALELLRNEDAQEWCRRLSHLSPSQQQRPRIGDSAGRQSTGRVTPGVDVTEYECCPNPHSQGARQLNFYVPLVPIPRGEGSFAALLRNRRDQVFGDDYDYSGDGGDVNDQIRATSNWRIRSLPLAARINLGTPNIGIPSRGYGTAMEACIRRVWLEHPPLSAKALEELKRSLAHWEVWKQSRAEQIDRFLVSDPRPAADVEAQRSVQKLIRKAFREAKVAKQKAREKARAARAQAVKEQQAARKKAGLSDSRAGTAATASTMSQGEQSTVPSTFGELNLLDPEEDGDTDEVDFPDSDEEEEDEETALLRQEAAAAFASAGGSPEGCLEIRELRVAMITVLGRAVKESEAESRLHALREKRLPRKTQGRHVKQQSDAMKASQQDLFHILLELRATPSLAEGAPLPSTPAGFGSVTSPEMTVTPTEPHQSSPSQPMLPPHETTVPSGHDGPVSSGTVEAEVEHATASQITGLKWDVPGGGVPTERMTAQGTGTKAVRSLSRMVGGGGEGESGDTGIEASTTIFKVGGALTDTNVVNSRVFHITPSSVSLGAIQVGCPVPLKLQVANVGDKPARFRLDSDVREGCVTVADYAKGQVAAGLAVVVSLEVLPRRKGALREVVRIVAEDGIADIVILGEAFECGASRETAGFP
eukprot:g14858.t2